MRLLLAEDDLRLAEALQRGLIEEGYTVDVANRGDDAMHLLRIYEYAAAIIDWRMPGMSGDEVIRRARELSLPVGLLMLTARDTTGDKVWGLDAGADDYIVKPVDFDELLARLRAVQRRPRRGAEPDLAVGDLRFDPSAHTASAGDVDLIMTSRELAILELLMRRSPAIVERTAIAHHAWQDDAGPVGSNTIDVHLSHIRRKLADAGSAVDLQTVRGLGYRLVTP